MSWWRPKRKRLEALLIRKAVLEEIDMAAHSGCHRVEDVWVRLDELLAQTNAEIEKEQR